MKVEDLMLGDWVFDKGNECYWQHNIKDYRCENRILCDFEPIPLTPEILEKNGFEPYERDNIVHYWKLEEGGVFIIVYNVENDFYVYVHYQKCEIDNAPGYFVHELQHALRLCGITLDIVV